jgi:hypothetical protein
MFGITLLTTFYLYSISQKDFKLDLKNSLGYQSNKLNEIMNRDKESQKTILTPELEKRMYLEGRDRRVIEDNLSPPERRNQEYQYPDRYVKSLINIPTRGLPDNYHVVGTLVRKADEKVLQLFGRQTFPSSNQWEYYVVGNDGNAFTNKMPLTVKGGREIENGQQINLHWLDPSKGQFEVNLYNFDTPRYNPYDY